MTAMHQSRDWPDKPKRRSPMDSGNNSKDSSCCPMVAAVKSVKQGRYRLARRYARMSIRVISERYFMRRKNALIVGAVAASLGAGLSLVTADPAMATVSPSGYTTVYNGCGSAGVGFCGDKQFPFPVKHGVCQNFPSYMNDVDAAVSNSTGYRFRFYKDGNCSGTYWDFYAHTENGDLTTSEGRHQYSSVRSD